RAGLGEPSLVETPIAVAEHLLTTGAPIPVGGCLVVCDLGAGFEASVVRRGADGFEVLATREVPEAGGDRLDTALADHLTALVRSAAATGPNTATGLLTEHPWPLLETIRAAQESLTHA